MACNTFPEYRTKILGEGLATASSQNNNSVSHELIHEETRSVSDTQDITYAEFSDGSVYLVGSEIYPWYLTDSSTSDNSFTTVHRGHIIITSNVNENALITIHDIKFATVTAAYGNDYIINTGYADTESSGKVNSARISREKATSTLPAEITYRLQFTSADLTETEPFIMYFRVQNNKTSVNYVYDTSV